MSVQATGKPKEAAYWADLAVARFLEGYNCSEAVLVTLAEHLGVRSDIIPAVATGFGGGIGRSGDICGAVTGGVMGLGLAVGRSDPKDGAKRIKASQLADQLMICFQKEWSSTVCRDREGGPRA